MTLIDSSPAITKTPRRMVPVRGAAISAAGILVVAALSAWGLIKLWSPCREGRTAACDAAIYDVDYSWFNLTLLAVIVFSLLGAVLSRSFLIAGLFMAAAVVAALTPVFDYGLYPQWNTADPSPGFGLIPTFLWAGLGTAALLVLIIRVRRR